MAAEKKEDDGGGKMTHNEAQNLDVYDLLAQYQRSGIAGWDVQDAMRQLHGWAEMFRSQFKLEIPAVPLRLARLRRNCLGHFNPGFNDFGLQNEIAIDLLHLKSHLRPDAWWEVLATLLHEQLHFWQKLKGKPSLPGPLNYHNVEYQKKAASYGMFVSSRGVNVGYDPQGRFLKLLAEVGVTVPAITKKELEPRRPRVGSKLKKWVCGCKRAIRVAVPDFNALCLDCNQVFRPA